MLRSLASYVIIYGLSSSISKFFAIFLVPIYARNLTPKEYGVMDLVTTVISVASLLGMLQLESAASRFYFEARRKGQEALYVSTAFWTVLLLSLTMIFIVLFLSNLLSQLLFKSDAYRLLFRVASLNIMLLNIFGLLTVIIRFLKKPILYSLFVAVQVFVTTGLTIWLVSYLKMGILGAFIGQLAGLFSGTLLMLIYLRNQINFVFRLALLRQFMNYSLPQVPAVAGSWLNSYANRFIMLGYLSLADIGLYAVALKIASIFRLLDNAFRMAWPPYLWEQFEKHDHTNSFRKTALFVSMGTLAMVVLFSCLSYPLTEVMTTKEYSNAATLIPILAFAFGFPIITQVVAIGPDITKRTIYNSIIFFIGFGINLASLFMLVPLIGLLGVPISLFLSNLVTMVCFWCVTERMYPIGFQVRPVIVGILITTVAILTYSLNLSLATKITIIGICLLGLASLLARYVLHNSCTWVSSGKWWDI